MPDRPVDLRSDTVTRPTTEMRRAMANAEVGDDGFGEDPTVRALEELYAERVGKEAALFVPSGTMANQIALRTLAAPATVVLVGRRQHIVAHEWGASGANSAAQTVTLPDGGGQLDPADIRWYVDAQSYGQPRVGLVCVENTHMPECGRPWDLDALCAVREAAGGAPVHMDGARLFNAEVATETSAARFAAEATTVMSCLSKGLGAPVGSVLAGPADVIGAARAERKRMGGAMRQSGVVAAAGLVALSTMVDRLADDHRRARLLADAVAERWPDAACRPQSVQTNIVTFRPPDAGGLLAYLEDHGVRAGMIAPGLVRLVTHLDVDDDGIDRARQVLAAAPG